MPTSSPIFAYEVCRLIMDVAPVTVLDVGIGFGKYGFLAREYADVWFGRLKKEEWKTRIVGIEIFEPYIQELQRMIYSEIVIGNALEVLRLAGKYDVIICGDVLEHFHKEQGLELLQLMKEKGKKVCVITPVHMTGQGSEFGNIYETHLGQWSEEELKQYGAVQKRNGAYFLLME